MSVSSLQTHLGDFYKEHVLKGFPKRIAANAFKKAVGEDMDLKGAAKARLAELDTLNDQSGGNLAKRCYVSHVQRIGLKEALND